MSFIAFQRTPNPSQQREKNRSEAVSSKGEELKQSAGGGREEKKSETGPRQAERPQEASSLADASPLPQPEPVSKSGPVSKKGSVVLETGGKSEGHQPVSLQVLPGEDTNVEASKRRAVLRQIQIIEAEVAQFAEDGDRSHLAQIQDSARLLKTNFNQFVDHTKEVEAKYQKDNEKLTTLNDLYEEFKVEDKTIEAVSFEEEERQANQRKEQLVRFRREAKKLQNLVEHGLSDQLG